MYRRALAPLALALLIPIPAIGQLPSGSAGAPGLPRETSQFDFLLGEWELTITPKPATLAERMHGSQRMRGTWKAFRTLDGWGIEDELLVSDRDGNPVSANRSIRFYDAAAAHWRVVTAERHTHSLLQGTARWSGREMVVLMAGGGNARSNQVRGRFTRVRSDAFDYHQDRSTDGGRTWEESLLVIEARRTAPVPRR